MARGLDAKPGPVPRREVQDRGRDPRVTSRMMAAVRNRNSKAELALRRELNRVGVRFRLHAKDVAGWPDIVIRKYRLAIFVDGDMWHGNAWRLRGLNSLEELFPHRTEWWVAKIRRNVARDEQVTRSLRDSGWTVVRMWESEVLADPATSAAAVVRALDAARQSIGARRSERVADRASDHSR